MVSRAIPFIRRLDVAHIKEWALKLATDIATTLLRIDQFLVAKPAGARDAD
jgi:chaperonin GroEL (HSP60 family)